MTKKQEEKTKVQVLVDLRYKGTINQFEEFYGECVSYQELEQSSYIEFKALLTKLIGKIKFRKARELSVNNILTCRLDMALFQYEKLSSIYEKEEAIIKKSGFKSKERKFFFVHDFVLKNLRLATEEETLFDESDDSDF